MRGVGDELTIGERVAFYRGRRNMTQRTLADLVDRCEDWVGKIERGARPVRRMDVIVELARALRVEVGDLLGQPVLVEDEQQDDDIPAVRDALMTPRRLSRTLFKAKQGSERPLNCTHAAMAIERHWFDYQHGKLGQVATALPKLIEIAQQLEDETTSTERGGWAVSARTHHLAATTLGKLGEADLAWIAAERAMHAADQADDPLVLASAARASTHALLVSGRFDDAVELGNTAAEWMRPQLAESDPAGLSLVGMLRLRTAVAAARGHDRAATLDLLERASRAADRVGEGANHWQTGFGPTNVELHRISTRLDLGDVNYVVDAGPNVRAENLPVERRVSHMIDVARALSLVARDQDAIGFLLDAEKLAPHLVRHNPVVRETVKDLYRRAAGSGQKPTSPLGGLAERCRALR